MRAVNDHGPEETACILSAVVRVIPGCAKDIGLEFVRHGFARSDWTLLNRWHAVEPGSLALKDAMPVKGSPFHWVLDVVVDGDDESVAPIGFNGRGRELAVDQKNASVDAIRRNIAASNVEVVITSDPCDA